ncbi:MULTISPECIES: peptidylprolyl isomerase [unclassified Shewanella]|jgi:peptidyl-prolyl cis-trans isomerase A (cyclophilin A)|uniref:peptidylprolyl isomerase n=1 Tax=Shewanella TaxID=22 RepID=UPI00048BE7D2|nr:MULTISPECIES: peptidylprolyl isomerase [unclassified Shewanella]GCF88048.1 peptidyl-prolyl cis-trans isomerase [Shewanella sp. M-Br]MBW3529431.1 peptidylprolyl isomerase [Shewanella sp. NKUCC06_TVS]MCU8002089.1 peptidylprolyl isomerase [Shewanella sp. SM96]MCU8029813.1 peptidylprolyl isomerase [Shewanella sp. SM73]MCU8059761.1 peptidylprolyl isomerase [Shewanella sp. SM55]
MKKLSGLLFVGCIALTGCEGSTDGDLTPTPPTPDPTPPALAADVCYLMKTTKGDITLAIDLTNMPITGKNFKQYVDKSFYNGTLFHRTINNFMIQGGGFTTGLKSKPTSASIKNEAAVGISNKRGTIAMARANAPDTAASQFFINVLDNPHLDASASSYGYAVFGKVVDGIEVADQISIVPTKNIEGFQDTPVQEILINSVTETSCPAV